MALWAIAFQGTTPIGGPLIGWITAAAGARVGLATGGLSAVLAAGVGTVAMYRIRRRRTDAQPYPTDTEEGVAALHTEVLR
jgi:hypothetical protein